jgi:TPR repeat protein
LNSKTKIDRATGDADGMTKLGIMYEYGMGGLQEDDAQAVSWYRKAAEAGSRRAMNNLGVMYEEGRGGLPKDGAQAVNWYRKAADAGDTRGMTNLGLRYENGWGGLPEDDAEAAKWYRKAAEVGNRGAMNNLGVMDRSNRRSRRPGYSLNSSWRRLKKYQRSRHEHSHGRCPHEGEGDPPKDTKPWRIDAIAHNACVARQQDDQEDEGWGECAVEHR